MFKSEIRILGFDDSPFKRTDRKVLVVGVIFRGGSFLDVVLKTQVDVDGLNSTEKLIRLINSSRQKPQLKVLMFDGIAFGGFNIIDIQRLHKKTGLPIIVINRKHPDVKSVENALKHFRDYGKRWGLILKAGKIKSCKLKDGVMVYYQAVGLDDEEAEEIIQLSSTRSNIPEPLRVAHLIGTAMIKGESSGRA
ncbi:MAG: DUF99 family protein [Candidatus Aenigmarchaeota archaeon]|nr:DUF99 family protein [Candidatus Aenigmarchaeota archaeon]